MPGPYTRENLIRVGFGDWAGHVLRGALEGDARLTFSGEEIVELVNAWLHTPELEQDEVGTFRAVVMPVGEEPADGDGIVRQDGRWVAAVGGAGAVVSVAGKTGFVVLDQTDVGLDDVDNTADADKPISTATQSAIDAVALSGKWKQPVKAATVATVTLGVQGSRTIDGYSASSNDRVLLLVQTDPAENGIYTVGADFALTRATDANAAAKLAGAAVRVEKGTTYADRQFALDTDDITLGTTPLIWTPLPTADASTTSKGVATLGAAGGAATFERAEEAFELAQTVKGSNLGKAPIAVAARVGEMAPLISRLGALVGPTYRPVFEAPRACLIDLVTFTPHTSIAASSFTWQANFVRRGKDWLSTRWYDRVMARAPRRFWLFNDTGIPSVGDPTESDPVFTLTDTTVFTEETGAPAGVIAGAPVEQAAGPPVHQQTAIAFDGTGAQYCRTVAADLALGNSPQTWVWWVKPTRDVFGTADQMCVMGADAATGSAQPASQPILAIRASGGGTPTGGGPNGVAILAPNGDVVVQTAHWTGLRINEWNLIQYVRTNASAGTDRLYVNGYQPINLWPVTTSWVDESSRRVFGKGRSGATPDYPFQGSIGPCAIYPQALTLADHRKDYGSVFWRSSAAWTFTGGEEVVFPSFVPDPEHREFQIGDVLWAEVVPLGGVAPIEDMTVTVIASAI